MQLINCEINHFLNWSANCFIVTEIVNNQIKRFVITYQEQMEFQL